jgi:hypothetical protein
MTRRVGIGNVRPRAERDHRVLDFPPIQPGRLQLPGEEPWPRWKLVALLVLLVLAACAVAIVLVLAAGRGEART